jgi:hypothetical protein
MGMWDCTCGVTYLPIKHGDKIRVILLRERVYTEDAGRSDYLAWVPVSLPIAGIYDDYGGIADVPSTNLAKFQAETIAAHALPLTEDETSGYRFLDEYPTTLRSLVRACERGYLKLDLLHDEHEKTRKTVRTGIFMVKESVYQAMIAPAGAGIGISRSRVEKWIAQSGSPVDSFRSAFANMRKSHLRRADPEVSDQDRNSLEVSSTSLRWSLQRLCDIHERFDPLALGPAEDCKLDKYPSLNAFTRVDWDAMDLAYLDTMVFLTTLRDELRRAIHPAMHTDQHDSKDGYDAHRVLAAYTVALCDEMEKTDDVRWKKG